MICYFCREVWVGDHVCQEIVQYMNNANPRAPVSHEDVNVVRNRLQKEKEARDK